MIKQFFKDERGQDVVEYSLLLVLVSAVAIFVLTSMGTSVSDIFEKVSTRLNQGNGAIS
jgi:pilus assembly protein Flp/PilA